MTEEDARRWRTVAAGILLGLGFLVALGRLFQLQVIRADELAQLAGRQYQKMLTVEGGRGAIFDRNGKILAITMDVPSVFGAPKYVSDPRATAVRLSRVLKADARQLEAKLKSERDFVWLQRHLTPERAEGLQGLALYGIGVIPEGRRFYPKGVMLSHVLGFGNIDNQGLEGLERRYDAALRGERGRLVVERDAFGGAVFPKGLNYVAPSPGKDLVLTIDEVIQYIADQELANVVARTRGSRASSSWWSRRPARSWPWPCGRPSILMNPRQIRTCGATAPTATRTSPAQRSSLWSPRRRSKRDWSRRASSSMARTVGTSWRTR